MQNQLKTFFLLTKPGIVFSNLLSAIVGLIVAHNVLGERFLFIEILGIFGVYFILSSATLVNNFIDRDIDIHMSRTEARISKIENIGSIRVLYLALLIGVVGLLLLWIGSNVLAVFLALFGYFIYIIIYSLYLKRLSVYSTIVGSLSGAVLPLIGYVIVSNRVDYLGIVLFLILMTWQMPHFYAIGIFRKTEYSRAKIPILSCVYSLKTNVVHVFIWIILFNISLILLYIDYFSRFYLCSSLLLGIIWLLIGTYGFWCKDFIKWARLIFFYSIFVLLSVFFTISIDSIYFI